MHSVAWNVAGRIPSLRGPGPPPARAAWVRPPAVRCTRCSSFPQSYMLCGLLTTSVSIPSLKAFPFVAALKRGVRQSASPPVRQRYDLPARWRLLLMSMHAGISWCIPRHSHRVSFSVASEEQEATHLTAYCLSAHGPGRGRRFAGARGEL